MSTCGSCGAAIEWVTTETNARPMPLDAEPRDDGNIVVIDDLFGHKLARYVPAGEGDRVSHFATCPDAASHRRR